MDKRTFYALLAKPLRRWEFLLGKFGGLVLTLTVNTIAMAAGLFLALRLVKHSPEPLEGSVLVAGDFLFLKPALGGARAVLFSSFPSPPVSILYKARL